MDKTSNSTASTIAVNLITGLLGSGKTTAIRHLLQYKPSTENWGLLINEFGEIGLDAALLSDLDTQIEAVSGGCICCTAQFGLTQALGKLIAQSPDRILIEPTGLGHPAQVIDTLKQFPQLKLETIFGLFDPKHLTSERWQKSAVMRDLATLADVLLLNKTDLASSDDLQTAKQILSKIYPPKTQILAIQNGQIPPGLVNSPHFSAPFLILSGQEDHLQQSCDLSPSVYHSQFPQVQTCQTQTGHHSSIGWIWPATLRFNRVVLKQFFAEHPTLIRAKGLIRTGKEWQRIQWVDGQLEFTDQAWRQDNRLELIFAEKIDNWHSIETKLASAINQSH